jgi:uncharacterized YigZ family protein
MGRFLFYQSCERDTINLNIMPSPYFIPAHEIRRELIVINSRFIATLAPAFSTDEARAFTKRIRLEFADASHNVPAYIIGGGNNLTDYCSDDGEPQGTAGRPALAVLRGCGLGDVVMVITRYFGGTLLGTGGLVKAYTGAAQLVVKDVPRAHKIQVHVVMLAMPYNLLERLRLLVGRHAGTILGEDFAADITMTMRFPLENFRAFQTDLQQLSSGSLQAEIIETSDILVPV